MVTSDTHTGAAVSPRNFECDTCGAILDEDTRRCVYGTCDGRMKAVA